MPLLNANLLGQRRSKGSFVEVIAFGLGGILFFLVRFAHARAHAALGGDDSACCYGIAYGIFSAIEAVPEDSVGGSRAVVLVDAGIGSAICSVVAVGVCPDAFFLGFDNDLSQIGSVCAADDASEVVRGVVDEANGSSEEQIGTEKHGQK